MKYTYKHSEDVQKIFDDYLKWRETLESFFGYLLFTKREYKHVMESQNQEKAKQIMKRDNLNAEDFLKSLTETFVQKGSIVKYKEDTGRLKAIKAYTNVFLSNTLDTILYGGTQKSTIVIRKTKSGKRIGNLFDATEEEIKTEPKPKPEPESYSLVDWLES
jgi:hypothetical protein